MKDNVKCGNKLTDVIRHPAKCVKGSSFVSEKEKMNEEEEEEEDNGTPPMETPPSSLLVSRPSNTLARLHGKLLVNCSSCFSFW